jgi:hypothetical protein
MVSLPVNEARTLSGDDFIELCRTCRQSGHYIPAVDVVGPGGWRVARVLPKPKKTAGKMPGAPVQMQLGLVLQV